METWQLKPALNIKKAHLITEKLSGRHKNARKHNTGAVAISKLRLDVFFPLDRKTMSFSSV